jgi:hypothetical protein
MGAGRRDEAGRGGAEHELEDLAVLAAHLKAPPLLVNREHRPGLEATAEMGDPGGCAGARHWTGRTEHELMLANMAVTRAAGRTGTVIACAARR